MTITERVRAASHERFYSVSVMLHFIEATGGSNMAFLDSLMEKEFLGALAL